MTEHPIIFSGPMVRAIRDNLKSQTRRVIKLDVSNSFDEGTVPLMYQDKYGEHHPAVNLCPYKIGQPLWVRENWWQAGVWHWTGKKKWWAGSNERKHIVHAASVADITPSWCRPTLPAADWVWRKRPSIHMPRWACRLFLEVTEVRVQRLNAISVEDAEAEGCSGECVDQGVISPSCEFRDLWDSLNAKRGYPWDNNDWVWATTFKRI